jgi:hypothetical protein
MLSASRLVPLCAGLALGSAATWTLLHLHSPPAASAALTWGETTFDPAYAWASALPDTKLGADLARELLAQLAATDPTRALALARAAGDEFFKASQQALFTAWAEKDPAAGAHERFPARSEMRSRALAVGRVSSVIRCSPPSFVFSSF